MARKTGTILTLAKTIPSGSHNAPYSAELGPHWPAGQRFRLIAKSRQPQLRRLYRKSDVETFIEQVGGEEVLVVLPTARFPELFATDI